MTFASLLADVVARLDRSGIPYMITGSIASSYHGEPRSTNDIDVVIDPNPDQLANLVSELSEGGYYVDAAAATAALESRSQFNAIAPDASKVDLIVRRDRAFSKVEFDRRRPADLLGTAGFVASAEDLVIAKLEWAKTSGSERQLRDIAGIVAIDEGLDRGYIEEWAGALGILDLWRRIEADVETDRA